MTVEPTRYAGVSKVAKSMLDEEGESGRFEFKQTSESVRPHVLVAAANWIALNPEVSSVTLLVGVEEVEDTASGLVTGRVIGLSGGLESHVQRINGWIKETYPVPVAVKIVEEGAKTARPFHRLQISPTYPPHFDVSGRRVVREGATTRPLVDLELLNLYLDREAKLFEERFAATAEEVMKGLTDLQFEMRQAAGDLMNIESEVSTFMKVLEEGIGPRIEALGDAAWSASEEAEESKSIADEIRDDLTDLSQYLQEMHDNSPEKSVFLLRDTRLRVWRDLAADTWSTTSTSAKSLNARMATLLEEPIDPAQWVSNLREIQFWQARRSSIDRKATQRWWRGVLADAEGLDRTNVLRLELYDERGDLRELARKVAARGS